MNAERKTEEFGKRIRPVTDGRSCSVIDISVASSPEILAPAGFTRFPCSTEMENNHNQRGKQGEFARWEP